jgi:NAD(P)-dependent dehydrogenase (short-subunit alcohol dehydrogenase family)
VANANLTGKVALITGAGGGIGSATAERLARAGATVMLTDINGEAVQAVTERLSSEGLSVRALVADLSQESEIIALVRDTLAAFGKIDILHNNAANGMPGQDLTILDVASEVWDKIFAINVRAPMLLCKHVLPGMIDRGEGGVIVNTSSQAAEVGQADSLTSYGSSKGALNSLTRYVAAQMGKHKIRCNAISLGVVLTDGLRKLLPQEHIDAMSRMSVLGRASEPQDIAAVVHFLASDDAQLITGRIWQI